MFRSCVVGIWAVRRGSPLSENDGLLACSMVNLAAHVGSCMFPSGATLQRHGDAVNTVDTLSVFRVYERIIPCLMNIVPGLVHVWST